MSALAQDYLWNDLAIGAHGLIPDYISNKLKLTYRSLDYKSSREALFGVGPWKNCKLIIGQIDD